MTKSNVDYVSLGACATMMCKINAIKNVKVGIKVMRMDYMSTIQQFALLYTWQDKSTIHKYNSRGVYNLFDLCESKDQMMP
jgi:hypothetical protein